LAGFRVVVAEQTCTEVVLVGIDCIVVLLLLALVTLKGDCKYHGDIV
jgi:hypothetical protein